MPLFSQNCCEKCWRLAQYCHSGIGVQADTAIYGSKSINQAGEGGGTLLFTPVYHWMGHNKNQFFQKRPFIYNNKKHHKSTKLPWHHNIKVFLSFCLFVFLSFYLLDFLSFFVFLSFCLFSCPEQLNRWPCHSLTDSLSQSLTHFYFCHTKSNPRALLPLRHLIRVMRRHDLTENFPKI